MQIDQQKYSEGKGWELVRDEIADATACQLVLAFGSKNLLNSPSIYESIRAQYPRADIVMNSTAGEIIDTQVNDESISLTAISFERTKLKATSIDIRDEKDSFKAGYRLASDFDAKGLKSVLVISDGHVVNGSDLVMGLQEFLPKNTIITGGLAGDGSRFKSTLVGLNEHPHEGKIVAIGFYGDALTVTYGSVGGWDPFGIERLITRSEANVLYELDGKPALDVYKTYLGEYADELPGSALLFPLSIRSGEAEYPVVRTILDIDEVNKSLVFAGNMPMGAYAQLMKANFDRLIEGASSAAKNSVKQNIKSPNLAILISCVGRKLVLDQRIEEEVEVIRATYGADTAITGFYSYGEISPSFNFMKCELHNQTMTITTLTEE
jgi:hypothetical protein